MGMVRGRWVSAGGPAAGRFQLDDQPKTFKELPVGMGQRDLIILLGGMILGKVMEMEPHPMAQACQCLLGCVEQHWRAWSSWTWMDQKERWKERFLLLLLMDH